MKLKQKLDDKRFHEVKNLPTITVNLCHAKPMNNNRPTSNCRVNQNQLENSRRKLLKKAFVPS